MTEAQRYAAMGMEELRATLLKARDDMQDVEDTFYFRMIHTNTHLADDFILDHEEELEEHRARVALLEDIIRQREQQRAKSS